MKESLILIVDDVPKNLQVVGKILHDKGYKSYASTSGENALKILEDVAIDLILLDISMPQMSGYDVSNKIKENPKISHIPYIFVTAHNETDDVVKGFQHGAVDYISKPFNAVELLHRVETHLNIKHKKDEILQQNQFLAEQNTKILSLVDELNTKNEEIISSIRYAEVIQRAVLPSEEFIAQFLPENFIINIPKDIVSGDFYWVKHFHNQIIVAVGDSTGHGVPGAFVSMLGITYLTEVVDKLCLTDNFTASEILNLMRTKIKRAFHQDRRKGTMSAGMDLALCIINIEEQTLQYAGAYSPLYIIRNVNQNEAPELIHVKPDRMPLAVHLNEKPFTNHNLKIKPNDTLYLFSDGYIDQTGGENKAKFKTKNFKDLLLEHSEKPCSEQKEILLETFNNWKKDNSQIDDVLVLGLKIQDSYGDVDLF